MLVGRLSRSKPVFHEGNVHISHENVLTDTALIYIVIPTNIIIIEYRVSIIFLNGLLIPVWVVQRALSFAYIGYVKRQRQAKKTFMVSGNRE